MKKKVIQVWTQKCKNIESKEDYGFWGLGDLIRGTIKLYQLSKQMDFDFYVNIHLHPISHFIKKRITDFDHLILQNKDNIEFVFPGDVEQYIRSSNNEIIYFLTNDVCDENITNDCKNFMKDILQPNDYLNQEIDKLDIKQPFNILHLRLGDSYIKIDMNDEVFHNIQKIVTSNYNENDILLCDSSYFKKRINEQNRFKLFDLVIGHIGYETDMEKIKNSLIEFFIISKSTHIKTYSVYNWISGFVHWNSVLYDIPLSRI